MMSDSDIRDSMLRQEIVLEPFDPERLEPASYDARVGTWAFSSSEREKVNLSQKGVLVIDPGEFAVVESREHIAMGDRIAGQLGLRSEYARRGLLMLSGPSDRSDFQWDAQGSAGEPFAESDSPPL